MNHRKVYMAIIRHAQKHQEERKFWHQIYKQSLKQKSLFIHGCYYENHHILPFSLFPLWDKRETNKVLLTAREHFFCHQLAVNVFPGNEMIYSLWRLMNGKHKYLINSKEYERAKKLFAKVHSEAEVSIETREKLSKANKNRVYGPCKESTKIKISATLSGRIICDEVRKNMSIGQTGKFVSESFREKCRITKMGELNPMYGKHYYNNGINTITAFECPAGWKPGRILKNNVKKGKENPNFGKKWFTNGVISRQSFDCPDGWKLGRSYRRKK